MAFASGNGTDHNGGNKVYIWFPFVVELTALLVIWILSVYFFHWSTWQYMIANVFITAGCGIIIYWFDNFINPNKMSKLTLASPLIFGPVLLSLGGVILTIPVEYQTRLFYILGGMVIIIIVLAVIWRLIQSIKA